MDAKIFLNESENPCFEKIYCNGVVSSDDIKELLKVVQGLFLDQDEMPEVIYPETILSDKKVAFYTKKQGNRRYYISAYSNGDVMIVVTNGIFGLEITIGSSEAESQMFLDVHRHVEGQFKARLTNPVSLEWLQRGM